MANSQHDATRNADSTAQLDSERYVSRKALANAPQSDTGDPTATDYLTRAGARTEASLDSYIDIVPRSRTASSDRAHTATATQPHTGYSSASADRNRAARRANSGQSSRSSVAARPAPAHVKRNAAPLHQKGAHKGKNRLRAWFESLPLDESEVGLTEQSTIASEDFHPTYLSDFMEPGKSSRDGRTDGNRDEAQPEDNFGYENMAPEPELEAPELPDYVDDPAPTVMRDIKSRRKPVSKRKDTDSRDRERPRPRKSESANTTRDEAAYADADLQRNLRVDVAEAQSQYSDMSNATSIDDAAYAPEYSAAAEPLESEYGAEFRTDSAIHSPNASKRGIGIPVPRPISANAAQRAFAPAGVGVAAHIRLPQPRPIDPGSVAVQDAELKHVRQAARQAMDGAGLSDYVNVDDASGSAAVGSDTLASQANALLEQWQARFNEKAEGNLESYRMQNVRRAVESVLGSCGSYSELEGRWNDVCRVMDRYSAPVVLEHSYLEMNRRLLEARASARTSSASTAHTSNVMAQVQPPAPSTEQYEYDSAAPDSQDYYADSATGLGQSATEYAGDYDDAEYSGDYNDTASAEQSASAAVAAPAGSMRGPYSGNASAKATTGLQRPPRRPGTLPISAEITDPDSFFGDNDDIEDYVPDRPYGASNGDILHKFAKGAKKLMTKLGIKCVSLVLIIISFISLICEKLRELFVRDKATENFENTDAPHRGSDEYDSGYSESGASAPYAASNTRNTRPSVNVNAKSLPQYNRPQANSAHASGSNAPVYVTNATHDHRAQTNRAPGISTAKPAPVKEKRKSYAGLIAKLALLCIVLVVIFGGYVGLKLLLDVKQYEPTFYPGVYLDGYELVGQTTKSAYSQLAAVNQYRIDNADISLTYGDKSWSITNEQLNVALNLQDLVDDCWNKGHTGGMFARQQEIIGLRSTPYVRFSSISYDTAALRNFIDTIKGEIDRPSVDATVSFDPNAGANQKFTVTDDVIGREINAEELVAQCDSALRSGSAALIPISPQLSEPKLKASDVSLATDKLVSFSTDLSKNKNRTANVKLALSKYNGLVVLPGEQVDFNKLVGPRTKEAGFNPAPEYSGTDVVEGIGGGVCQASTTLYGALLRAGMQIDRRANHNMTVSYVPASQDAAVSYPGKTLTFTNSSDYPIFFDTLVTDEKASVAIYGYDMYPNVTITVESEVVSTEKAEYKTVSDPNFEHAKYAGDYFVEARAYDGVVSRAYRIFTDDTTGEVIKKEDLGTDRYSKREGLRYYGGVWNG